MQLPGMRMLDAYRLAHYGDAMRQTARTVEQVVGGIAGASGLALDERTQTPLHLRPRQPLHLERCGLCPRPDRRGQGLSEQLQRAAGLSRRAGAG